MSLRRTLAVALRLLRQLRNDRRTLAMLFVAPVVILLILGDLQRHAYYPLQPIGVVNLDADPFSEAVAGHLESHGFHAVIGRAVGSQADAERQLRNGDIGAYVLLPPGFAAGARGGLAAPEIHLDGAVPFERSPVDAAFDNALFETAIAALPNPRAVPVSRARHVYVNGSGRQDQLDYTGPAYLVVVVFFLTFIVTSITFLRERTLGTLERLMASPLRRAELVLGYVGALGLVAVAQGGLVVGLILGPLAVDNQGSLLLVALITVLVALAAVNLGILTSVFARTEFQAVQFIPLVITPQLLLAGILFPVDGEPEPLRTISKALPLTYAVDAIQRVMLRGQDLATAPLLGDLALVAGFAVLVVALAALTLRRRAA